MSNSRPPPPSYDPATEIAVWNRYTKTWTVKPKVQPKPPPPIRKKAIKEFHDPTKEKTLPKKSEEQLLESIQRVHGEKEKTEDKEIDETPKKSTTPKPKIKRKIEPKFREGLVNFPDQKTVPSINYSASVISSAKPFDDGNRVTNIKEYEGYSYKKRAPIRARIFLGSEKIIEKIDKKLRSIPYIGKPYLTFVSGGLSGVLGFGKAVFHPIKTVKGIGHSVTHPMDTGLAIKDRLITKGPAYVGAEYYMFVKTGQTAIKIVTKPKVIGSTEKIAIQQTRKAGSKVTKFTGEGVIKTQTQSIIDKIRGRSKVYQSRVQIKGGVLGKQTKIEMMKGKLTTTQITKMKGGKITKVKPLTTKTIGFRATSKIYQDGSKYLKETRLKSPKTELLIVGKGLRKGKITRLTSLEKQIGPTKGYPSEILKGWDKGKLINVNKQIAKDVKTVSSPEWSTTYSTIRGLQLTKPTAIKLMKTGQKTIKTSIKYPKSPSITSNIIGSKTSIKTVTQFTKPQTITTTGLKSVTGKTILKGRVKSVPKSAILSAKPLPRLRGGYKTSLKVQLVTKPKRIPALGRVQRTTLLRQPRTELRTDTTTKVNIKPAVTQKPKLNIIPHQTPRTRLSIRQQVRQQPKQKQSIKQIMSHQLLSTPSPKGIPTPSVYSAPKIPKLPVFPIRQRNIQLNNKIRKRLLSPKTKYNPSLIAISEKIRGRKPKRLTGIRVRPIVI